MKTYLCPVEILLYIWAAAAIVLMIYYLIFHLRLVFYKNKKPADFAEPVSVVICARNEAANLRKNLPKILTQKNCIFEVLVVNDRSTDESAAVLDRLRMQYPNLRVVENKGHADYVGKKQALLLGLKEARHAYFVLTDADCEPQSDQWLSKMSAHFASKNLILGFSPYYPVQNLAGMLTQWETLLTAQQYLSFALAGIPYMGVGRNMAYSRTLFEKSDHFASHLTLPSGDDDLFVGKVQQYAHSAIEISEDSFTWSHAPKNFKSWWRQKRRHLSTSYSYRPLPAFLLGLFGLSQLVFYTALWPLLFGGDGIVFWILLALKFVAQLISLLPVAYRLKQKQILWLFPVWEFLVVVFLGIIHLQNKLAGRPQKWS